MNKEGMKYGQPEQNVVMIEKTESSRSLNIQIDSVELEQLSRNISIPEP